MSGTWTQAGRNMDRQRFARWKARQQSKEAGHVRGGWMVSKRAVTTPAIGTAVVAVDHDDEDYLERVLEDEAYE